MRSDPASSRVEGDAAWDVVALKAALDRHCLFAIADANGVIREVNDYTSALTGFSQEELVGHDFRTAFPAVWPEGLEREVWRALRTDGFWRGEVKNRKKSGESYWLEATIFPAQDKQGTLREYIALGTDVTERRRVELALRMSQNNFAKAQAIAGVGSWEHDLASGQLFWSEQVYRIFSLPEKQPGPTYADFLGAVHPEDVDGLRLAHRLALSGDARLDVEHRVLQPNGNERWVHELGELERDSAGRAVRFIGICHDITTRKKAEAQLAEQAALLDAALEGIYLRDLEGKVLYWSKGAERTFGWSAEEARGKNVVDLLYHATSVPRFEEAQRILHRNGEWKGEMEKFAKDGRALTVEVSWTLVRGPKGEPKSVLAIEVDVTARKRLEAQFLRAQRLESLGTLAGGIAHDLNNVLAPIMMALEFLRMDEREPERLEMLDNLQASAQRGSELIRQVLSFARGIEGKRLVLNLRHIAREVQKIVREAFPKSIEFRLEDSPDLWAITGDATQLHQVMMNLCVNARDAMPAGGRLSLALSNKVLDEVYSGMNPESKPGPYVVLEVSDTGHGMRPEVQDRVFEPFFTTKEPGKGTGLGLSTTLAIVKGHGGFVHVYSELDKGTTFRVYLPASAGPESFETVAVEQTQLPRGNGELVLVIDDEEGIRSVAKKTLERFGYRVLLAANGAEAVGIYADKRAEIAMVITDMAMPILDGAATIVALKQIDPKVRIVASSGESGNGRVEKALSLGVQKFVLKPYTAELLLRVLREVLNDRNPLDG